MREVTHVRGKTPSKKALASKKPTPFLEGNSLLRRQSPWRSLEGTGCLLRRSNGLRSGLAPEGAQEGDARSYGLFSWYSGVFSRAARGGRHSFAFG